MRILVLDEEIPFPTNTGKRTRSFNLYRRLARQFNIRYLGFVANDAGAVDAMKSAGIETVAVEGGIPRKDGAVFYLRLLANLASPLPYIVSSHYSHAYREVLRASLSTFRPDLIICEWTPYAIYVRDLPRHKRIVSAHNVEADIWQRYHENEQNPMRRWYIKKQWRKVKEFERAALGWIDGLVAVSEQDRERFAQTSSGPPMTVVPNGVDLDYFRPMAQSVLRKHLVFTGSMDWRPNQDAARYFVREVWPLLRRAQPDLECTFVGRSPPSEIRALADVSGIHITGTVSDVRPYVERAAVYVVPLRIGGGSRLKILEALAMGRAVVSTTVGAEGLDVVHNRHVVLADDPPAFAEAVLGLLAEPERCQQLGEEGRRLVEEHYGWDVLAAEFGKFIREVAGERADRSLIPELA